MLLLIFLFITLSQLSDVWVPVMVLTLLQSAKVIYITGLAGQPIALCLGGVQLQQASLFYGWWRAIFFKKINYKFLCMVRGKSLRWDSGFTLSPPATLWGVSSHLPAKSPRSRAWAAPSLAEFLWLIVRESEKWRETENSWFFAEEVHCKPRHPGDRAVVFTQLYTLNYLEIFTPFGYKQTFTLSEFRQGQKLSQEYSLSEWGQSSEGQEEANPFQVALSRYSQNQWKQQILETSHPTLSL